MAVERDLTICALLYGEAAEHMQLHDRCVRSIYDRLPVGRAYVKDIRIGLNAVSESSRQFVSGVAEQVASQLKIPVILYDCRKNAFKYPLMRSMIYDEVRPAQFLLWLDDDSALRCPVADAGWWQEALQAIEEADMVGQPWHLRVQGAQWLWIQQQDWYNPAVGPPPPYKHHGPAFYFCTGGWWIARTEVLQRFNWPVPELRHCGGDSMLGELIRHQQLRMRKFDKHVWINADESGRPSKAPRRGHKEEVIGKYFQAGQPVDLAHQTFECQRTTYGYPN